MSELVEIARALRDLQKQVAALQRLEQGSGGGGGGDADTLDGLDSTAFALASHAHSGADITSGTVADAYIDAAIARDSEVMSIVLANDGSGSGLDADTVDGAHYEEGNITPTLTFGGGSTGIAGTLEGVYSKTGNQVTFTIRISLTSKGSSTGTALISGLPYSAGNANKFASACAFRISSATLTGDILPEFLVNPNTSTILCGVTDSGVLANMTDAHFTNTTLLFVSGSYRVA